MYEFERMNEAAPVRNETSFLEEIEVFEVYVFFYNFTSQKTANVRVFLSIEFMFEKRFFTIAPKITRSDKHRYELRQLFDLTHASRTYEKTGTPLRILASYLNLRIF